MKLQHLLLIAFLSVFSLSLSAQDKEVFDKVTVAPGIEVVKLSSKAYFYVSYDNMGSFGIVPCNGLILVNNGEAALLDTPANNERTAMLMD